MHGKGGLGTRVLQQTVGDGGAGTLKGFLARLEQQLNRGVGVDKRRLAGLEQARRSSNAVACISCPHACMQPFVEAKGSPDSSATGRASMSPRSMMTVPACSSVQTPLPWPRRHRRRQGPRHRNHRRAWQMGFPSRSGALEYTQRSVGGYYPARASGVNRVATQRGRLQSLSFCNETVTDSGLRRCGGLGR